VKIPLKFRRASRVAIVLIGLMQAIGTSYAGTEISDQFGLKDRAVGLPLHKLSVEKGDVLWAATRNVVLGGEGISGFFVTVNDNMPFAARVALPTDAKVITVEAEVRAVPSNPEKPNFVAVGIGNPQLGTPTWGKGVYVFLQPTGHFVFSYDSDPADFTSKSAVPLKGGEAFEYTPDKMTKVKLEYNDTKHTVSAWVNGVPVLQDFELKADYVVEPMFAGVSGYAQAANAPTAGKFTVTVAP